MEEQPEGGKWRKSTAIILAVVTGVLVVWDIVVVFLNNESNDSISRVIQGFGQSNWAIPFAFGMIFVGHFFWPGRPLVAQPWAFIIIAIPWTLILAAGLMWDLPRISTLIPALLGILAGRFFWPLPPV
jgi:hypothetical protein